MGRAMNRRDVVHLASGCLGTWTIIDWTGGVPPVTTAHAVVTTIFWAMIIAVGAFIEARR